MKNIVKNKRHQETLILRFFQTVFLIYLEAQNSNLYRVATIEFETKPNFNFKGNVTLLSRLLL